MPHPSTSLLLAALLGVAACATVPTSPSVLVLPGTAKTFDQFRLDDGVCRQFAYEQVAGVTLDRVAEDSAVRSAAVGTVLGAAVGAAIDGRAGAGLGAGTGLPVGGIAGAAAAERSAYNAQRRYDFGYQQCMYAKGHQVPVSRRHARSTPPAYYPPPPPPSTTPPPALSAPLPPPQS